MEGKTRHQLWMDLCDLVREPQWFHPMESRHKNSPHEIQVMLIWILILQSISYHSLQYQEVWVYIVGICNLFSFPPLRCYSTILYSSTKFLVAITFWYYVWLKSGENCWSSVLLGSVGRCVGAHLPKCGSGTAMVWIWRVSSTWAPRHGHHIAQDSGKFLEWPRLSGHAGHCCC